MLIRFSTFLLHPNYQFPNVHHEIVPGLQAETLVSEPLLTLVLIWKVLSIPPYCTLSKWQIPPHPRTPLPMCIMKQSLGCRQRDFKSDSSKAEPWKTKSSTQYLAQHPSPCTATKGFSQGHTPVCLSGCHCSDRNVGPNND